MFRLLRFFSVISGIAFVIVGILLFGLVQKLAIGDLIEFEENKNVALAEAIIESSRSGFSPSGADALRLHSDAFREAVRAQLRGSSVVRVQIFDLEGLTLFSTDESEVGTHASEIANSRLASQGRIASELTHRAGLGDLEGTIEERDLVSSYIPMRFDSPIEEGVLAVHSDVTDQLRRTKETQQNVIVAVLLILSTLFIVLFAAVRLADRIIQGQYAARQRAEAALRHAHDHLEEQVANRTAEVEAQARQLEQALKAQVEYNNLQREFVALASHEFRTPLSIIDMAAQGMIRRADKLTPEEIVERHGIIRDAVKSLVMLIESTLSAAQLDSGSIKIDLRPVCLAELLKVINCRQQEISPSRQIDGDLENLPDEISADPRLLEQVFTNLLSNAVKYSPDDSMIEVTGRTEGDEVIVAVRDHGFGIPADELPRIFQRYFRARTATGIAGTGIGLNLVKQLVEMHSGSIQLESLEGEGSTFTVRLPIKLSENQATGDVAHRSRRAFPKTSAVLAG